MISNILILRSPVKENAIRMIIVPMIPNISGNFYPFHSLLGFDSVCDTF